MLLSDIFSVITGCCFQNSKLLQTFKNSPAFSPAMEKADAAKENALKDKYAELRMATAQIKQLQQQLEAVEEKKLELSAAVLGLDDLKNAKQNTKMLAPISDGIFVNATVDNTDELVVNVGGNICVKKTVEQAKGMLGTRLQEMVGYQENILEELNKLTDNASQLEKELGQMLEEPK